MKRNLFFALCIAVSFGFGFAYKSILSNPLNDKPEMKRVTGIGGIFFKCKDPKQIREWYKAHLGFNINEFGAMFEWREDGDPSKKGNTQWSPFSENTKYFEPSTRDFMINYRVENLENLVKELQKEGVTVLDTIDTYDYGKFVHILDPEGNKIELWEPVYETSDNNGKSETK